MAVDAHEALSTFEFAHGPTGQAGPDGGDGFCVRDTLWRLFGWPASGAQWAQFPDWQDPEEFTRLLGHLGLREYRLTGDAAVMEQLRGQAHPGLAVFAFPTLEILHIEYVYSAAVVAEYWDHRGTPVGEVARLGPEYGWPLPWPRRRFPLSLASVVVDERQAPHPPTAPYI